MQVTIALSTAGEWVQIGFTKSSTYQDRAYIRARVVSATKTLEIEYRETIGGSDSLIATQSFTTGLTVSSLSTVWWLIYDPDYGTLTGIVTWASVNRNLRAVTTCTDAAYGYVGTETITGTATITNTKTRHCYSPIACPSAGNCFTDRAPHEWEIDLSGVALGDQVVVCEIPPIMGGGSPTPVYGYHDWYDEMNAVHVPISEGGMIDAPWWQMRDTYTWADTGLDCQGAGTRDHVLDVRWRVTAYWWESAISLITRCSVFNPFPIASMNPTYNTKPCLLLNVEFEGTDNGGIIYRATWAAIVESDWDSDVYTYYGDEHVMTPNIFPAVCNFDWRTISNLKMTFICGSDAGVDFTGSSLYLTAKP
jgi:hypothetical protein